MILEPDPFPVLLTATYSFDFSIIVVIVILVMLLIFSALMSGSEVAYFSFNPGELEKFKNSKKNSSKIIIKLLNKPEKLLATILISNNIVNVAFVILSVWLSNNLFDFTNNKALEFIIQGIVITVILLFFGEILPKVWVTTHKKQMAVFMTKPLIFLNAFFTPLSSILMSSSSLVNKKFAQKNSISMNDLSHAIDLASDELQEEEKILKGIVNFSNLFVKEIMQSRIDVVYIDIAAPMTKVTSVIVDSGFSRIPVVKGDFDHVAGILYIKDLLPHLHKHDFKWQTLIRSPFYVPETKRINDLLTEFKSKKNHMAIVVDEYGGSSGIITLEDILEEIVGEISDEFDTEMPDYMKIDEDNWIFEGKTTLTDFYKVFDIEQDIFEEERGETDSIAGLVLETMGRIPAKNEKVIIKNFTFKVKASDNRRIKQLFVKINRE